MRTFAELSSTQDFLINEAQCGAEGRLAVLAEVQTQGRGSRGRRWSSFQGNLHLSVLLRPGHVRPQPGYWALTAAVALYDTLASYVSGGLMLKWPNDLLLNGKKIGGILIDCSLDRSGLLDWIVIGAGANLAEAPGDTAGLTARLPQPPPSAYAAASSFLHALDHWAVSDWRSEWLVRAHPLGTMIRVETPGGYVEGRFAGLNDSGALLLEGRVQPVSTGEIFLVRRSSEELQDEALAKHGRSTCFSS